MTARNTKTQDTETRNTKTRDTKGRGTKSRGNRRTAYKNGVLGEHIARLYLVFKGYRVLKLRYKTKSGEIDLIAKKAGCICFVEVKSHQNTVSAAQAITRRQKQRIARAALIWCRENPKHAGRGLRFDALLISGRGIGLRIQHLRNAWSVDEIGLT